MSIFRAEWATNRGGFFVYVPGLGTRSVFLGVSIIEPSITVPALASLRQGKSAVALAVLGYLHVGVD
jgi:hypothetical protein